MITREIRSGELLADRYRVIHRLGVGGMATVWLAQDEKLGRDVAVKRLNTDAPEESLTRFRREARLGATLNHPNFVSVYDTVAADDCALIVMEYVPGQSLEDLTKRGAVDPDRAISILKGAASAIDHAHAAGVVHRDIKPANIMLRDDGTVKVADLGIARAVDATQITAEGKVIGTMPYMAPERLEGPGSGGPASDVYALAAVAYELLSGSFVNAAAPGGEHPPDRRALAARWPDAPAQGFAAIMRGLSEDPARRQRSAGELVDQLADGLVRADEPTQPVTAPFTPPFTPPRPERRPQWTPGMTRRTPRGSRTGALLALALVALAGIAAAGIGLVGGGSGGGGPKKEAKAAKKTGGSSGKSSQGGSGEPVASAPAVAQRAPAEPAGSSSADGATLNAQGFALIQQGRAAEAVPILRQAVGAYPEGSSDLNYAYALYNLGNALRLSGHADEAIPILERRLQIPDQRSTVAAELARARAEAATG